MILKRLSILNYRNIAAADLEFSPKINCFVGRNGVGKTNTLDAIHFLSLTKSIASHVDSMNIRHGQDVMMVQGLYDINGVEEEFTIGMKAGQKKHVKRNKKEHRRLADHIGLLPLIIASPADAQLIAGGSEERRRLMDVVISQYDPDYMAALTEYNRALAQRNTLLRAEMEADADLMAMYEEMMAERGETIYQKRQTFIDEFIPVFQRFHNHISGGAEEVGLRYTSHGQRGPLLDTIRGGRAKDMAVGYSLHGTHKDDIEMTLGGYPVRREGSQGQNKTYALALKLAQFDFLRRTGSRTTPLLLLDDIFDKLDQRRVEQIINIVLGENFGQIFITDTNRENLDRLLRRAADDHKIFCVEAGQIDEGLTNTTTP